MIDPELLPHVNNFEKKMVKTEEVTKINTDLNFSL